MFDVERGLLPGIRPEFWQTDTSISKNSWGFVAKQDYKTAGAIIGDLVDIVSKNGALLLNIGPRPDGTIPEPEQEILREIGRWLKVNGEAVYGTRPWATYGEGPTEVVDGTFNDVKRQAFTGQDVRFTTKPGALYAIALAWPGKTFTVKALGTGAAHAKGPVSGVSLLGHEGALTFSQDAAGLHVTLPEKAPGQHAFAFRIEGVS